MVYSVIGSNYGDEGKGLATDYLASLPGTSLVIRHNGGAQSGHTVELNSGGKRFIFHELSSGSFRHADTYWADSFYPDMYKIDEEMEAFHEMEGFFPCIYVSPNCNITTIDDVLLNMLYESSREERHGSCAMGINEADLRTKAGFGISAEELFCLDEKTFYERLVDIRRVYTAFKYKGMPDSVYLNMLKDDIILRNFAAKVIENRKYIKLCDDEHSLLLNYDKVIFENGQGLLLDSEKEENWPHVTASRTGLSNVLAILDRNKMKLDEAVYVTRSYLTKHGAGPLVNEDSTIREGFDISDNTNITNEWQGSLRFARWTNPKEMVRAVCEDLKQCSYDISVSQFLTHLNETSDEILFVDGSISIECYMKQAPIASTFNSFYLSRTPYSKDCIKNEGKR